MSLSLLHRRRVLDLVLEDATYFNIQNELGMDSLLYPSIYKSSDFPELTTTKDYFFLYSTDHSTTGGAIYWAEMDDKFGNGFEKKGTIISGYQAETPFLIRIPSAKSGISDELFLYYHTKDEPGHTLAQETRLITTSGGADLSNVVWNDRGRPMGVVAGDNDHTGYCRVWELSDGTYVAHHLTSGTNGGAAGISTSADGLSFTRITSDVDLSLPFTSGVLTTRAGILPFYVNGTAYGIVGFFFDGKLRAGIFELDQYFWPSSKVKDLGYFGIYDTNFYIENGVGYYFKYLSRNWTTGQIEDTELYLSTYTLSDAPNIPAPEPTTHTVLLAEDFTGTTLDTSKGTIENPDSADLLVSQNDKLLWTRVTDNSVGNLNNRWLSVDSFTRGAVSVLMNRDIGYDAGVFDVRWNFDSNNFIAIQGGSTLPRIIKLKVKSAGAELYGFETTYDPDRRIKITYDANNDIKFWAFDVTEWDQLGETINVDLGASGGLILAVSSDGSADDVNDVFSMDELRVTDEDYKTELP